MQEPSPDANASASIETGPPLDTMGDPLTVAQASPLTIGRNTLTLEGMQSLVALVDEDAGSSTMRDVGQESVVLTGYVQAAADAPALPYLDPLMEACFTQDALLAVSGHSLLPPGVDHDAPWQPDSLVNLDDAPLGGAYGEQMDGLGAVEYTPGVVSSRPERRRGSDSAVASLSVDIHREWSDSLARHVADDRQKCEALGLPCLDDLFNSTQVQERISFAGLDNHKPLCKLFFFVIACPQTLESLKDVVEVCRRPVQTAFVQITNKERLEAIEVLAQTIPPIALSRRCHVLHLFLDNLTPHDGIDGFITTTPYDVSRSVRRRSGNPRKLVTADMTLSIMREVYPGLSKGSAEYKRRYRKVNDIRKLGERLKLLVDRFGRGILGLLPLPGDASSAETSVMIRDQTYVAASPQVFAGQADPLRRILSLSDDLFRSVVIFLEQTQGDMLRTLSCAVEDIVSTVSYGPFEWRERFKIDGVDRLEIARHPKGSRALLEALRRLSSEL